jgi:hypothetical protein
MSNAKDNTQTVADAIAAATHEPSADVAVLLFRRARTSLQVLRAHVAVMEAARPGLVASADALRRSLARAR